MLFAEIICNQRTRSLLGPHVSSINVAGEIKPWLMHGLFCLWETGCVCDFYLFFYFSVDAVRYSGTDMTEAAVDTRPDPDLKAFARTARLITLLNGNLMPLCPRVCVLSSATFLSKQWLLSNGATISKISRFRSDHGFKSRIGSIFKSKEEKKTKF